MLRRLLMAMLVVVAVGSLVEDSQASCNRGKNCQKTSLREYFLGGCGPGPFGRGEFGYAGYYPAPVYSCCGHRIK